MDGRVCAEARSRERSWEQPLFLPLWGRRSYLTPMNLGMWVRLRREPNILLVLPKGGPLTRMVLSPTSQPDILVDLTRAGELHFKDKNSGVRGGVTELGLQQGCPSQCSVPTPGPHTFRTSHGLGGLVKAQTAGPRIQSF